VTAKPGWTVSILGSEKVSAWRVIAAALAAFAVGAQLLLSGLLLVGHFAQPVSQVRTAIICSHDGTALAGDVSDETNNPAPRSHHPCPACACLQSSQALLAVPMADIVVLRPGSQPLTGRTDALPTDLAFRFPYASRAPPHSA
jgi:hypothetical protein